MQKTPRDQFPKGTQSLERGLSFHAPGEGIFGQTGSFVCHIASGAETQATQHVQSPGSQSLCGSLNIPPVRAWTLASPFHHQTQRSGWPWSTPALPSSSLTCWIVLSKGPSGWASSPTLKWTLQMRGYSLHSLEASESLGHLHTQGGLLDVLTHLHILNTTRCRAGTGGSPFPNCV